MSKTDFLREISDRWTQVIALRQSKVNCIEAGIRLERQELDDANEQLHLAFIERARAEIARMDACGESACEVP